MWAYVKNDWPKYSLKEVPPSFIVMNDNKNYIKIGTSYLKSIEENREDKINNILNEN